MLFSASTLAAAIVPAAIAFGGRGGRRLWRRCNVCNVAAAGCLIVYYDRSQQLPFPQAITVEESRALNGSIVYQVCAMGNDHQHTSTCSAILDYFIACDDVIVSARGAGRRLHV